jgi:butyrate kinase
MKKYKILVINLGSTSTKVAYYEDRNCIYNENVAHDIEDLNRFPDIFDQYEYRYHELLKFLQQKEISVDELDCVVTRGGHSKPVAGGVYYVNELMVEQSKSRKYGTHPCDLGLQLALKLSEKGMLALTVDPPSTDEFEPLARYSGMPEISRISAFQALNQRAAAKKYAEDVGKDYSELNLIVVHLGGGISVVMHKNGKMVDGNNALFGDGPFSTNRTGGLPVGALIDMCYSGKYTHAEMKKKTNGAGGLVGYVGDNNVKNLEERAKTEPKVREVLEAMCYQVAKEIGAAATVLKGKVDAVVFTGGMANSKMVTSLIRERVEFIAPVHLYPGEFEMETLALNAYNVLTNIEVPKELKE